MNLSFFSKPVKQSPPTLKQNLRDGEKILYKYTKSFAGIVSASAIQRHADIYRQRLIKKNGNDIFQILASGENPIYKKTCNKALKVQHIINTLIRKKREKERLFLSEMGFVKKMMQKYRVGNCREISDVIYEMAKKEGQNPIKLGFNRCDHCFVVIGLEKNENGELKKRSIDKAVVIDGWCQIAMPMNKALQYYEEIFHKSLKKMHESSHGNKPSKFMQLFKRFISSEN